MTDNRTPSREALKYVRHLDDCVCPERGNPEECTCGLSVLIERMDLTAHQTTPGAGVVEWLRAAFDEGWDAGISEQRSWGGSKMSEKWGTARQEECWEDSDILAKHISESGVCATCNGTKKVWMGRWPSLPPNERPLDPCPDCTPPEESSQAGEVERLREALRIIAGKWTELSDDPSNTLASAYKTQRDLMAFTARTALVHAAEAPPEESSQVAGEVEKGRAKSIIAQTRHGDGSISAFWPNEAALGQAVDAVLAALSKPQVPAEGVEERVLVIAKAMEPRLFDVNEIIRHGAASPLKVEVAQERVLVKAHAILAALSAQSPAPADSTAGDEAQSRADSEWLGYHAEYATIPMEDRVRFRRIAERLKSRDDLAARLSEVERLWLRVKQALSVGDPHGYEFHGKALTQALASLGNPSGEGVES